MSAITRRDASVGFRSISSTTSTAPLLPPPQLPWPRLLRPKLPLPLLLLLLLLLLIQRSRPVHEGSRGWRERLLRASPSIEPNLDDIRGVSPLEARRGRPGPERRATAPPTASEARSSSAALSRIGVSDRVQVAPHELMCSRCAVPRALRTSWPGARPARGVASVPSSLPPPASLPLTALSAATPLAIGLPKAGRSGALAHRAPSRALPAPADARAWAVADVREPRAPSRAPADDARDGAPDDDARDGALVELRVRAPPALPPSAEHLHEFSTAADERRKLRVSLPARPGDKTMCRSRIKASLRRKWKRSSGTASPAVAKPRTVATAAGSSSATRAGTAACSHKKSPSAAKGSRESSNCMQTEGGGVVLGIGGVGAPW